MAWVAGVDGCSFGWLAVLHETSTGARISHCKKSFAEILELPENPQVIAVDMPIGLADEAIRGGRICDGSARKMLGRIRGSSVFSSPVRAALAHTLDYASANCANRKSSTQEIGLSRQSFGILRKIKEVDELMSAEIQNRVFEVHPELCFYEMNGSKPIESGKRSSAGAAERRRLLEGIGFRAFLQSKTDCLGSEAALDDLLDASAACWSARRIMEKTAVAIPENSSLDAKSLRMQIWR